MGERDRNERRFIIGIGSCGYETTKSHILLSASWRTRKAGGLTQLESKDLRTGRTDGVSPDLGPKPENQEP